ncbi:hypothetical protein B0H17DRAFT_349752 [Mycena rosella]|uniref:Uncharacterized protein n=1 Tax=Mycena rosella TaxID=1033263 RepID=A0AAD7CQJ4_MYCRO|nr:hypothetical protein B0H17DRAFT_349752 [Mycena rosella]
MLMRPRTVTRECPKEENSMMPGVGGAGTGRARRAEEAVEGREWRGTVARTWSTRRTRTRRTRTSNSPVSAGARVVCVAVRASACTFADRLRPWVGNSRPPRRRRSSASSLLAAQCSRPGVWGAGQTGSEPRRAGERPETLGRRRRTSSRQVGHGDARAHGRRRACVEAVDGFAALRLRLRLGVGCGPGAGAVSTTVSASLFPPRRRER